MSKSGYQFFRYTVASATAFVVDAGLLYGLTELAGLHYLLSATIGFICGAIIAYAFSVTWVFDQRRIQNTSIEFIYFLLIGISGLLLNNAAIWLLTERVGIYYLGSKILATGLVFFFNFFARRNFLFIA